MKRDSSQGLLEQCTWRDLAQVHLFPYGVNSFFMHAHASYIFCLLPHQSYGCIFKYFNFPPPWVTHIVGNTNPNDINALPLISVGPGFQISHRTFNVL